MKAPANFTASATKKVNPLEAAINSNFSQKIPVSSTGMTEKEAAENPSSNAREAVLTNENANSSENTSASASSAAISSEKSQILNATDADFDKLNQQSTTKTPARREVKEKFLVSMSKGERSVFKAFCAMQNVSMNHFVMCAMDYFKEDLENGKVSLSAHSYKRKES
ncbi:MAG: hypothetical protein IJ558_07910 [Treponema sp.]|nr:hypothetical protein [Treponema sp.]